MPRMINSVDEAKAVLGEWLITQGFEEVQFSSNSGPTRCPHCNEVGVFTFIVMGQFYAAFCVTPTGEVVDHPRFISRCHEHGILIPKTA